jgi:uncharacterized protein YfaS (alpha-2-macroglobulin family)
MIIVHQIAVTIMKKFLFLLAILIANLSLNAQKTADAYISEWRLIDSFIVIKNTVMAEKQLSQLNERALRENNATQIVKTTLFKTVYQYAKLNNSDPNLKSIIPLLPPKSDISNPTSTEGYLSAINDLREIMEASKFPEKRIFQSLLAEIYRGFLSKNTNHVVSKDVRGLSKNDLRTLSKDSIYALSTKWYIESATDDKTKTIPITEFDALTRPNSVNDDVFRPNLYDFLAHRALDGLSISPQNYGIYYRFQTQFSYGLNRLLVETDSFLRLKPEDLLDIEAQKRLDSLDNVLWAIRILQNLTRFHCNDSTKFAQTDSELRRLAQFNFKDNYAQKYVYLPRLQQLAAELKNDPSVIGVIEHLSHYYEINGFGYNQNAYDYNPNSNNYEHRYFPKKAYDLCRDAVEKFPNIYNLFSLRERIKRISKKQLTCTVEKSILPEKPILAFVGYRNTDSLYARWLRIPFDFDTASLGNDSAKLAYFLREKPIKTWKQALPSAGDFQMRKVEVQLEAVPIIGRYLLLVSTAPDFVSDTSYTEGVLTKVVEVTASNLATWFSSDETKCVVVNRTTGVPLPNVKMQLWRMDSLKKYIPILSNQSDKMGLIQCPSDTSEAFTKEMLVRFKNAYTLFANRAMWTLNGDTFRTTEDLRFDKNDTDNSDNPKRVRAFFFTDRNIYRPNQTIKYQCIMTVYETKNKPKLWANKKVIVAFGREDDLENAIEKSILTTNEFGSVSGSFTAPTGGELGEFNLIAAPFDEDEEKMEAMKDSFDVDNERDLTYSFRIEEYKRPRFEVFIDPVKSAIQPNAFVEISGRAEAFAGNAVDGAKVELRVERTRKTYYWYGHFDRQPSNDYKTFIDSTFQTAEDGGFTVRFFNDIDSADLKNGNIVYDFRLFATVTDKNGEVHSKELKFTMNRSAFYMTCPMPPKINRQTPLEVPLSIKATNGTSLPKINGRITIDLLESKQMPFYAERLWSEKADTFLYNKTTFNQNFPDLAYQNPSFEEQATVGESINEPKIIRTVFSSDLQKLFSQKSSKSPSSVSERLDDNRNPTSQIRNILRGFKNYKTGDYRVTVKIFDPVLGDNLTRFYSFKLFDTRQKDAQSTNEWVINLSKPSYFVGDKMSLNFETPTPQNPILYELIRDNKVVVQEWIDTRLTRAVEAKITEQDRNNNLHYRFSFVKNNRFYTISERVSVSNADKLLNIDLMTFRDRLSPDQEETWTLKILDYKNRPVNAELVATLYDESLDKLMGNRPHRWYTRFNENQGYNRLRPNEIGFISATANRFNIVPLYHFLITPQYRFPREMNWFDARHNYGSNRSLFSYLIGEQSAQNIGHILRGAVSYEDGMMTLYRLNLTNEEAEMLNGMTVIGYGTVTKRSMSGSVSYVVNETEQLLQGRSAGLSIRGSRLNNAAYYVDGIRTEGLLESVVVAGYGAQPDPLAAQNPLLAVKVRKNFNETVFFKPQMHTQKDGSIALTFRTNDALTRWRFMASAHTQDLKLGEIQRAIVTTKQLMVVPNMPRFLREGDSIEMAAKISNVGNQAAQLHGQAMLQLFDAATMQPINQQFDLVKTVVNWSAKSGESIVVKWRINVPSADNLSAVTWRIVATTDNPNGNNLSDGEENTLPILPKNILITETHPLSILALSTQKIVFPSLENAEKEPSLRPFSWSMSLVTNPIWNSVTALSYSMEYPHECSEQLFSRFYANTLASNLLSTTPQLREFLQQKKDLTAVDSSNNYAELRRTIMEEAPWLSSTYNGKNNFSRLFDLNKMALEQTKAFEKLATRRTASGGLSWYPEGEASWYITQHIVAGLGHLKTLGATVVQNENAKKLVTDAIDYLDNQIVEFFAKEKQNQTNYIVNQSDIHLAAHYLYARSFYPDVLPSLQTIIVTDSLVLRLQNNWQNLGIYEQALNALALHRMGKKDLAQTITNALEKRAIKDSLGMYFLQKSGYTWYEMPVETQALMMELFAEVKKDTPSVNLMKTYLLSQMENGHWYSTKATTEAIYALVKMGGNVNKLSNIKIMSENSALNSTFNSELIADKKAEKGYLNIVLKGKELDNKLATTIVNNQNNSPISGSISWRYYADLDKIKSATSGDSMVVLTKKMYIIKRFDDEDSLVEIKNTPLAIGSGQVRIGDKLRVILTISVKKRLEYVHLKDSRPSNCEPVDVLSQRNWTENTSYYKTTRDVSTNFFFDVLNVGSYSLNYDVTVQQNGDFSSGIATLGCMYAPQIAVHTEGGRLKVK